MTGPQADAASASIGLVCKALGYDSRRDIDDLAGLHFAVRADRPGHLESDDQTAGDGDFPLYVLTAARHPQLAEHPDRFSHSVKAGRTRR